MPTHIRKVSMDTLEDVPLTKEDRIEYLGESPQPYDCVFSNHYAEKVNKLEDYIAQRDLSSWH